MMVVGLTGSIAMGKSEVASVFRSHGIPVFDADAEVHAFYDSPEGVRLIKPLAPKAIGAGRVNRDKLAAAILGNRTLFDRLEKTVHDEIARRRLAYLSQARKDGEPLVIVDLPLLFEKGLDQDVDVRIVVSASPTLQRHRALARPGMTPDKLDKILARQMPDAEKRRRADIVIENDGSLEDLRRETEVVIGALRDKLP